MNSIKFSIKITFGLHESNLISFFFFTDVLSVLQIVKIAVQQCLKITKLKINNKMYEFKKINKELIKNSNVII